MKVFIDDFNLLRIESDLYIYDIYIENNEVSWLKNEGYNQFFTTKNEIILHINDHIYINHQRYPLNIGLVTLKKSFEKRFRYDGDLGFTYSKDETSFTLFSPVAKEVILNLGDTRYNMIYEEPVWKITVKGDHDKKPYSYDIRLVDEFNRVSDPYAIAAGLNQNYVIDWNKTVPMITSPIKLKNYVDAVIYEGHVRDMSITLDVESKGLYEGLIQYSNTLKGSVLEYIKSLGMTHLQLLPIFDFDDVFDENKNLKYNWGYNPSQYFAVEGWYSDDPSCPYRRINELKNVINKAHEIGLGVNMDVVYNHVYDHLTFPYDKIVPGYFYRHDNNYKMTNMSFCGNEVESRNYMVRKLIIDSLTHFTKNFQFDGFRFDLMGLHDIETMLQIKETLEKINPSIMLYGEGWNMPTEVPGKDRSNMHNNSRFLKFAHFNDFYRNTMKGDLHGMELGFTNGNPYHVKNVIDAILGSKHIFQNPNQSLNFVECHDNYTYFDKTSLVLGKDAEEIFYYQTLANHLIAISQGVPFYHAGQEFYRTKQGVENSYNSPDEINKIVYPKNAKNNSLKKILKLRKKYKLYRQNTYNDSIVIEKVNQILVYYLENNKYKLTHYIKNTFKTDKIRIEEGKIIFASQKYKLEENELLVDKPGIYLIYQKK